MDSLTEGKKAASALDVFAGGGEMGELMRSHDWSNTPLGPVENWPPTLRTCVSMMLSSRFAQGIYWGEDYIQLYNDAAIAVYGANHPTAKTRKFVALELPLRGGPHKPPRVLGRAYFVSR
ncbi:multi-sensor signal transduction histidine kinase [Calothrix sp. NIES-2100]|uniref:hypothetical protein n=1 Tax=Calothrix sp. NIES-2100 TaxID=1954172 RepID=UPI000B5E12C5|nr:multi-sensor signal transduction histidine kinase [Calothrix sp. NIES-2100]